MFQSPKIAIHQVLYKAPAGTDRSSRYQLLKSVTARSDVAGAKTIRRDPFSLLGCVGTKPNAWLVSARRCRVTTPTGTSGVGTVEVIHADKNAACPACTLR